MRIVKAIVVLILLGITGILVSALVIDWPESEFSRESVSPAVSSVPTEVPVSSDATELKAPFALAEAFGYVPPVVVDPKPEIIETPKAEPEPQVAAWIQSVGSVTSGDGGRRFVLKLTAPRESIVSLAVGEKETGILLVEVEKDRLLIERNGERYFVLLPGK